MPFFPDQRPGQTRFRLGAAPRNARLLGITEATRQRVETPYRLMVGSFRPMNEANQPFTVNVIGMVLDFNFQPLREKIAPMVLTYENNPIYPIDYFTARIEGNDIPGTLA